MNVYSCNICRKYPCQCTNNAEGYRTSYGDNYLLTCIEQLKKRIESLEKSSDLVDKYLRRYSSNIENDRSYTQSFDTDNVTPEPPKEEVKKEVGGLDRIIYLILMYGKHEELLEYVRQIRQLAIDKVHTIMTMDNIDTIYKVKKVLQNL